MMLIKNDISIPKIIPIDPPIRVKNVDSIKMDIIQLKNKSENGVERVTSL